YVQRFLSGLTPTQMAAGPLVASTLLLAGPMAVAVARQGLELTPLRVLCVLALGCLGTGYALMPNYRTVRELGPTTASLVTYLVPVVGVTPGVLVLGEPFSFPLLGGGLPSALRVAPVQGRLLGPPVGPPERPCGCPLSPRSVTMRAAGGGVAQPGRALRSQRRSQGFKSPPLHPKRAAH